MKRSSCGRGWGVEAKVEVKAKAKVEAKAVTGRSLGTTCVAGGPYAWLTILPIGVARFT